MLKNINSHPKCSLGPKETIIEQMAVFLFFVSSTLTATWAQGLIPHDYLSAWMLGITRMCCWLFSPIFFLFTSSACSQDNKMGDILCIGAHKGNGSLWWTELRAWAWVSKLSENMHCVVFHSQASILHNRMYTVAVYTNFWVYWSKVQIINLSKVWTLGWSVLRKLPALLLN